MRVREKREKERERERVDKGGKIVTDRKRYRKRALSQTFFFSLKILVQSSFIPTGFLGVFLFFSGGGGALGLCLFFVVSKVSR